MRHIIVAVDGSDASTEALRHAVQLARQDTMLLTGVFVVDAGWPDYLGHDWQSSAGARQGFLSQVHREQEQQAEAARRQFEAASAGLAHARFEVLTGDPLEVMRNLARHGGTDLLILSRRVFQVSGRPRLHGLARALAAEATGPLSLFP